MTSLGAVVVSFNEGHLLRACLSSLDFVDELLVLLMNCTDDSETIARSLGARVEPIHHEPIVERVRNEAMDRLGTEWVFFVDPDEQVPGPTGQRLRFLCETAADDVAGFRLPMQVYGFGQPLVHTFPKTYKASLFRASRVRWPSQPRTHHDPHMNGELMTVLDTEPVANHAYQSVSQAVEKAARYAVHGERWDMVSDELDAFAAMRSNFRSVLLGRSWMDGSAGVAAALIYSTEQVLTHLVDWERAGSPSLTPSARRRLLIASKSAALLASVRSIAREATALCAQAEPLKLFRRPRA